MKRALLIAACAMTSAYASFASDAVNPITLSQGWVRSVQLTANGAATIPSDFTGELTVEAVVSIGVQEGACSKDPNIYVTPGTSSGSFVIGAQPLSCSQHLVMKTVTFDALTFIIRSSDDLSSLRNRSVTVNQTTVSLSSLLP